jgi:hypothetical protein
VAPRTRRVAYGFAGALVVAGAICAGVVPGVAGEVLTITLISAGLGGALLLVFLEIGFGEERDLQRDEDRRRKRLLRTMSVRRRTRGRPPRRPQ